MGYSYIRISIGASDFSLSEYTYCDNQGIENFALQSEDKNYVIPVLKEILAINPNVKILASPWTCPKWMKVNNLTEKKPFDSWTSGQLNPDYYQDYATYFVKYIQAMKAEGINIASMTIQNEPLNRGNSVSLYMTVARASETFIKTALGPAFRNAGINTKIIQSLIIIIIMTTLPIKKIIQSTFTKMLTLLNILTELDSMLTEVIKPNCLTFIMQIPKRISISQKCL